MRLFLVHILLYCEQFVCVNFFVGLFEGKGKKIITDLVLVIVDVLFTFLLINIFKKILFFSSSRSSDIQCHATFRLIRDKIFLVLY